MDHGYLFRLDLSKLQADILNCVFFTWKSFVCYTSVYIIIIIIITYILDINIYNAVDESCVLECT